MKNRITVLKNKVDVLTIPELHNKLAEFIKNDKKAIVDYLNIYSSNISFEEPWFREFLNSCEIVLCDGKGIQLGARFLSQRVPDQIPYNRWLWDFFAFCEKSNFSIFFLGSAPGIYEKAITRISEKGYDVRMSGYHGYFDKSNEDNDKVLSLIADFKPDFLLVGFGMPLQEKWVINNYPKIQSKVIILGGAYLDWISGSVKTPPELVSKLGLEWAYRLVLEPRRLGNRYLIGIPQFFFRILSYKILKMAKTLF